jgi:(2Fe-2S) ferredoxin
MPIFEKHIFICGNQRAAGHPRGCCDPTGQAELQKLFKKRLAEGGLRATVRANKAGCLDQCEHGPNVVVYPDGVWYGNVSSDDVDEIIDSHIVRGVPVARLMLPDSCINTPSCEHKPRVKVRPDKNCVTESSERSTDAALNEPVNEMVIIGRAHD